MQKWEYGFVVAHYVNEDWRVAYVNGKDVSNKNASLYDYANQVGEDGWELVAAPYTSVASTSQATGQIFQVEHYYRLIFKRPKA